jgi:hypothetical protein
MTDSYNSQIVLDFLASGHSINERLHDEKFDKPKTIVGSFLIASTEFTREPLVMKAQQRTFKPGLIITHDGAKNYVPDITQDQFIKARKAARREENGLVIIDLEKIQKMNQKNPSFRGRRLPASLYGCFLVR